MRDVNKERARARALVEAAVEREPRLDTGGLGVFHGAVARQGRAYLLSDTGLDEVATCARWLELNRRSVDAPLRVGALAVERWAGRCIRPGALLAAVVGLGLDYEAHPWGLVLNLGMRPQPAR